VRYCGEKTRSLLPKDVEESGYSERAVSIVSVLSGMYRHSHRMVVCTMSDLFGVKMSLGTVNRLRKEGSEALSALCGGSRSLHPSRADSGSRRDGIRTRKCRWALIPSPREPGGCGWPSPRRSASFKSCCRALVQRLKQGMRFGW
jgi:hypothetical protein